MAIRWSESNQPQGSGYRRLVLLRSSAPGMCAMTRCAHSTLKVDHRLLGVAPRGPGTDDICPYPVIPIKHPLPHVTAKAMSGTPSCDGDPPRPGVELTNRALHCGIWPVGETSGDAAVRRITLTNRSPVARLIGRPPARTQDRGATGQAPGSAPRSHVLSRPGLPPQPLAPAEPATKPGWRSPCR